MACGEPHGSPVVVARLRPPVVPGSRRAMQRAATAGWRWAARPTAPSRSPSGDVGQPPERGLAGHRAQALAVEHQLRPVVWRQLLPAVVDGVDQHPAGVHRLLPVGQERNPARQIRILQIRRSRCRRCTSSPANARPPGRPSRCRWSATITSTLRSKAPVRSSSRTQHGHPALVVGSAVCSPAYTRIGSLAGLPLSRVSSAACGPVATKLRPWYPRVSHGANDVGLPDLSGSLRLAIPAPGGGVLRLEDRGWRRRRSRGSARR